MTHNIEIDLSSEGYKIQAYLDSSQDGEWFVSLGEMYDSGLYVTAPTPIAAIEKFKDAFMNYKPTN